MATAQEKNLIDFDYLLSLEKDSFLEFVPYKEKDINLLGRWNLAYSGDQEIFDLLIGDSSNE